MNRLGLIIGLISEGESKIYISDSAKEWERYYIDPRNYVKKVENHDSTFVDFVCYGDDVALVYMHRKISGRDGDCLFGMLTVPNGISISGVNLDSVISQVKEELSKTKPDNSKLDTLFATQYGLVKHPGVKCRCSYENADYAYQKYGNSVDYNLHELLDKNLFNVCYTGYKAVFLISDEDNIIPASDVVELCQDEVEKCSLLKYPSACNYKLYIKNKEFVADYPVRLGAVVEIEVRRKNCQPNKLQVRVDSSYMDISNEVNRLKWKKNIKKEWFHVTDTDGKRLNPDDIVIKIDGTEICGTTPIEESTLYTAYVTICCPGYKPKNIKYSEFEKKWAKANNMDVPVAELERTPKTYNYIVYSVLDDKKIIFPVEEASYDEKLSPLHMYKVDSVTKERDENIRNIYLAKIKYWTLKKVVIFAFILFVMLIAGVLLERFWFADGTKETKPAPDKENTEKTVQKLFSDLNDMNFNDIERKYTKLSNMNEYKTVKEKLQFNNKQQQSPAPTEKDSDPEVDDALNDNTVVDDIVQAEYLKNGSWIKSELEAVGLNGLFEAMNNYDYSKIKEIFANCGPEVNNVNNVKELLKAIEREPNKKDAPYNDDPNDFTITLKRYTSVWGTGQTASGNTSSASDGASGGNRLRGLD